VSRLSRFLGAVGVAGSALLLGSCADFGGPVDGGRALSPTEIRLQATETKLADVSRRLESLNQVILDGGTGAGDELRILRGEVEKLRFDLDGLEKRSRDLYQDLDRRLVRLEGGGSAAGIGQPMAPGAAVAPPAPQGAETPAAPEEESAYLQTFDLLKNGRYDDAIRGFKSMIQKWPDGRYTDNAWYWMGEAFYVKREFPSAIQSFQTVPERFPTSPKAPDALLKLAAAQSESRQKDQARASLQRLVRDYPNSNAANLARQRLAQP
jgi:tol-pal system protein YbgF